MKHGEGRGKWQLSRKDICDYFYTVKYDKFLELKENQPDFSIPLRCLFPLLSFPVFVRKKLAGAFCSNGSPLFPGAL